MKNFKIVLLALVAVFILVNGYFILNKPVVLNFYSHPDKLGFLQEAIKDFEKSNRNIRINLVQLPDNTNEKYEIISSTLALKDGSIDIIDSDVTWPAIFVNAGWVEPLDEYFSQEELDEYLSSAIDSATIKGKLYGIPYRIDSGMFYYRKDLLDKYNIPVPKTWKEVVSSSKHIMASENKENLYGFAGSWYQFEGLTCNYLEILWSNGGDILDEDNNLILGDRKKALESLTLMTDMIYKDNITPEAVSNFKSGDVRQMFADGNLIYMRDWPAGWKVVNDDSAVSKGLVGVAELPYFENYGDSHGTFGGWLYMLSNSSLHKKESIKFIKFLTGYEQEKSNALLYSYLPSRKELYNDEEVIKDLPYLEQMLPFFNQAKPRPRVHNYDIISYILQEEVSNSLTNYKTPEKAISNMYKRINEIIK